MITNFKLSMYLSCFDIHKSKHFDGLQWLFSFSCSPCLVGLARRLVQAGFRPELISHGIFKLIPGTKILPQSKKIFQTMVWSLLEFCCIFFLAHSVCIILLLLLLLIRKKGSGEWKCSSREGKSWNCSFPHRA